MKEGINKKAELPFGMDYAIAVFSVVKNEEELMRRMCIYPMICNELIPENNNYKELQKMLEGFKLKNKKDIKKFIDDFKQAYNHMPPSSLEFADLIIEAAEYALLEQEAEFRLQIDIEGVIGYLLEEWKEELKMLKKKCPKKIVEVNTLYQHILLIDNYLTAIKLEIREKNINLYDTDKFLNREYEENKKAKLKNLINELWRVSMITGAEVGNIHEGKWVISISPKKTISPGLMLKNNTLITPANDIFKFLTEDDTPGLRDMMISWQHKF